MHSKGVARPRVWELKRRSTFCVLLFAPVCRRSAAQQVWRHLERRRSTVNPAGGRSRHTSTAHQSSARRRRAANEIAHSGAKRRHARARLTTVLECCRATRSFCTSTSKKVFETNLLLAVPVVRDDLTMHYFGFRIQMYVPMYWQL
jgi:hypothetical protein